jgi:hypothetical protein
MDSARVRGEESERDALMVRRSLREEGSCILVSFPWPWPAMEPWGSSSSWGRGRRGV